MSLVLILLTNLCTAFVFLWPMTAAVRERRRLGIGLLLLGIGYALLYRFAAAMPFSMLIYSHAATYLLCHWGMRGSASGRLYRAIWIYMVQSLLPALWWVLAAGIMTLGAASTAVNEVPGAVTAAGAVPPLVGMVAGVSSSGAEGRFYLARSPWMFHVGYLLFFLLTLFLLHHFLSEPMASRGNERVGPRQLSSAVVILLLFDLMHWRSPLIQGGAQIVGATDIVRMEVPMVGATDIAQMGSGLTVIAELYCVTFLYLQYTMFRESAVEQELMTMAMLARQQREQYELSRENIALINRKTHDLKHQVRALRHMDDSQERARYLDEIDDSIRIYEAIVKTGSEVLDIILTEKSLLCREKGIEIHCVADGALLSFIEPVDLYGIFGNVLDNAVEEVQQFAEPEKRQIDVLIHRQQGFLLITVQNPVFQRLTFEGGLPKTTKGDTGYHGFGLRSVQHTVEKYGGHMTISVQDGMFLLKLLVPLP